MNKSTINQKKPFKNTSKRKYIKKHDKLSKRNKVKSTDKIKRKRIINSEDKYVNKEYDNQFEDYDTDFEENILIGLKLGELKGYEFGDEINEPILNLTDNDNTDNSSGSDNNNTENSSIATIENSKDIENSKGRNTIVVKNNLTNDIYTLNKESPINRSRLKNEIFPKSVSVVMINNSMHYCCDLCKNICKNYKELTKDCNNSVLENRCKETELCSLFRDFIQLFKLNYSSFENTGYYKYVKNKLSNE